MATATKKAGNTAKTNTKSNNRKTAGKKAESAKSSEAKTVEKKPMTVGDGMLDHTTKQNTAKAVEPEEPKRAAKKNGKVTSAKADKYHGLNAETLVQMYRTMYQSRRI